jgi:hypothetical protein
MTAFPYTALLATLLLTPNSEGLEFATARGAVSEQATTSVTKPTVYVADFEIDVVPTPGGSSRAQGSAATPSSQAERPNPEEEARKLAGRLVELMSSKVMAALQKAGYSAVRMHRGDARPESGVQIRGVYAEVDNENHWRRAVIRNADDSGKMQALVTVANLSKPEQKLYEIAQLPGNEDKAGAVITLSPYVPLSKFDLSKDAKEDVFQKIAPRIVDDLTALLNANPAALTQ